FGFGRRDVADGLQQPAIVEPVDPGQGRELDGLEAPPRPTQMNDFSLVKAIDRLGESVVVAVSDAAHGRLAAGFRQTLGVSNANVLGEFKRSSQHSTEEVAMNRP